MSAPETSRRATESWEIFGISVAFVVVIALFAYFSSN
jgi:hypothetical protein